MFNVHSDLFNNFHRKVIKLGATDLTTTMLSHRHYGPNAGHKSTTICIFHLSLLTYMMCSVLKENKLLFVPEAPSLLRFCEDLQNAASSHVSKIKQFGNSVPLLFKMSFLMVAKTQESSGSPFSEQQKTPIF